MSEADPGQAPMRRGTNKAGKFAIAKSSADAAAMHGGTLAIGMSERHHREGPCAHTMASMRWLKKTLRSLAVALLVPLLLFEEWGWEPLAAVIARLARLPLWARVETRIRALPPWAALLLFLLPVALLLPLKLFALFLLGAGHALSALVLLLLAKLAGTAIVALLFQLVQPTLMRLRWFALAYPRWKAWKDALFARVRQSAPWRAARHMKNGTRRWWRGMLRTS